MSENESFKIDFLGIGVSKSGTSWIFQCLKEHPQICGSSQKEIHFFDKPHNYKKGISYYKSFFEHCDSKKLKGEFTPSYLHYKKTVSRIHKYFPNVKLIVSLRNPIERAYSHYRWAKVNKSRVGHYKTFQEAIEKSPAIIEKGYYYKQLNRYYDLFPEQNILVKIFDDLKEDPLFFIQDVYKFLELTPYNFDPPSASTKRGATGGTYYKNKLPVVNNVLWKMWSKINPPDGYGLGYKVLEKSRLRRLGKKILEFNRKKAGKTKADSSSIERISPESKVYLYELYQEDIEKLEGLINKKLDDWKVE